MSTPIFMLHTYTPGETETVTGVTTTMQRDWRRHGHIPKSEAGGHTRNDIVHLANLLAMRWLGERLPLNEAKEIAVWAKNRVLQSALAWSDCWSLDEALPDHLTYKMLGESFLRQHVENGRVIPGGKLIIWANGEEHFCESIDAAFAAKTTFDPQVQGATVVLDLDAMGGALVDGLTKASPLKPMSVILK